MAEFFWIAALLTGLLAAGLLIGGFASRRKSRQMSRMLEESPYGYLTMVDAQLRQRGIEPLGMSISEKFDAHLYLVRFPRAMRNVAWPLNSLLWLLVTLLLMVLGNMFVSAT